MVTESVKVGVIGVGFGSVVQIPGFQSEGVEILAVAARREERAQEAAERFGIPSFFTDYRKMLEVPEIEAVSIVSPVPLHKEMAIASLEAGKHVLCEKPFAVNQRDAHEMLETSQRNKHLTAMIGHEFRWAPQRAFAKDLLDQGYIGKLHFVNTSLLIGRQRPATPPLLEPQADLGRRGGFLWGLGSHYIDAMRHWFGDIVSVTGKMASHFPERTDPTTGNVRNSEVDDSFSFIFEFANGGWGTMMASSAAPAGQGAVIEIFGNEGSLSTPQALPGVNPPQNGVVYGGKSGDAVRQEIPMPDHFHPFDDDRDARLLPFRLMVREFVRGIRGGTSPAPNFYDGYKCQQVLDAVVESSQTGRRVEIPLDSQ